MLLDYSSQKYKAVILDMDGVITETSHLHAMAWKQMFNEFLQKYAGATGQAFIPFEIETDYFTYVDGVPRLEAIRNFLNARKIAIQGNLLPASSEVISMETLSNRKNELFHEILSKEGLGLIEDTIEQAKLWKEAGLKLAVATSSRNASILLNRANISPLFDTKVDGIDIVEMRLSGKPAPDIFLKAAAQLGISPAEAVIIEDAQLGVEAGRAGGFGLVVGLATDTEKAATLVKHGADLAVLSLKELKLT